MKGVENETEQTIILSIRVPRVLLAGLVGAGLSVSGAVFQALLRNPLADPYILGVSSGAAVGAIIAILTGLGAFSLGHSAGLLPWSPSDHPHRFLFWKTGGKDPSQHPSPCRSHHEFLSLRHHHVFYLRLPEGGTSHHHLLADGRLQPCPITRLSGSPFLISFSAFFLLYLHSRQLNLILLGEENALQLGVNVERLKWISYFLASLITAASVSVCGLIGFVGLIVPHSVRLLFGPDHRLLLPASALVGASFLIASDTIARTLLAPVELPVGVVTAAFGGPFFIYLLRTRKVVKTL